jgi:DNA-directed RNA polymerase specialized sigma24 family protein
MDRAQVGPEDNVGRHTGSTVVSARPEYAMSNPLPHNPNDTAARAIAGADLPRMMPKLLRAARRRLACLGWHDLGHRCDGEMEAGELVNETLALCLEGTRTWVPGAGETEETLMAYLCKTMSSVAVNRHTSGGVKLRVAGVVLERHPDDGPSPEEIGENARTVERVARDLADDPDVAVAFRMICEGKSERQELARACGWPIQKAKTVRWRLMRRLAKLNPEPMTENHEHVQPARK